MRKIGHSIGLLALFLVGAEGAQAQSWPWWAPDTFSVPEYQDRYRRRAPPSMPEAQPYPFDPRYRSEPRTQPNLGGDLRDGGPRPFIEAKAPPVVEFRQPFPANSIVIDSGGKRLYYVLPGQRAYVYRISVGREGFNWTGTETISRKQAWPDWHPPAEMRERDPRLPIKMTGGLKNPLGAVALYLGNTLYRIHGTNDPRTIGQAASSGCFRMLNSEVLHLASLADIGTKVTVIAALSRPPALARQTKGDDDDDEEEAAPRTYQSNIRAPALSGRPPSYRRFREQP